MKLLSALTCLLLCFSLVSSQKTCSYYDVLNHLQLKNRSDLFTLSRPVLDHNTPTEVELDVLVYAILDVRASDQTFISYVWTVTMWENDFIRWNMTEFCDIENVPVPIETLWKPDLTIEEMTEKDKSTPSPYLLIFHNGSVLYKNDQVVMSTCRLHVFKFPFDTQRCNLSFRSVLLPDLGEAPIAALHRELHSPVMFFLFLDFASFLMPDTGGEKLGFKITILLAVTVMQLLLNDILPASSNRIPLIAIYCIGIYALMLLSLLEAIVVLYLINRDQRPDPTTQLQTAERAPPTDPLQSEPADHNNVPRNIKQMKLCKTKTTKFCRPPPNQLQVFDLFPKRSSSRWRLWKNSNYVINQTHGALPVGFSTDKIQTSDPALTTLLTHLLQNKKDDDSPGYWLQKSRTIHRVFFTFYCSATVAFLGTLFYVWTNPNIKCLAEPGGWRPRQDSSLR
ncbi:hypothetical protein WMY93_010001 [Mugilogobius chulae]|uniref:Neurotransmitter-gated ion-channel ligand-binding domain-containing protein n=1 Tax=Mugilogobius chulae TaxID=88201 RepID=A0AAW0P9V1_9GOBI